MALDWREWTIRAENGNGTGMELFVKLQLSGEVSLNRNDETDVVIVLVSIGAWTEEMDGVEGPRLKMHLRTELPA